MRSSNEFQRLLDKLSSYTYGILYNDGQFVSDKEEMNRRDGADIIVQTSQMMDEHKAGMCHDASIYVDDELTRLSIPHKCVYIASHVEPMLPTHSFVLAFDEDTLEWIVIDVFASKNCIYFAHMFKDMNEAIGMRVASWIRDDNKGSPDLDVFTLEHMPKGGVDFVEYSKQVVEAASNYEFNRGYAHIEYEGVGVYQALKKAAKWDWKDILKNEDISWLPKPPEYNGGMKSYFTMKGYREFKSRVMPIVEKYLDESNISEEYVEEVDENNIVYADEFQIVVKKLFRKFDDIYELVMNSVDNLSKENSRYFHNEYILSEAILEKNAFRHPELLDDFTPVQDIGITEKMIFEAFQNTITESDDPDYYVKLPAELVKFTKDFNNKIVDKLDILTLFPEFEKYDFPQLYILFFNFSNEKIVRDVINGIKKFNDKSAVAAFSLAFLKPSNLRGLHLDLTKFGIPISLMYFNEQTYNIRTIYHEWSHFFQVYVGNDFKKYIILSAKNEELKNKKLMKYGLSMNTMRAYFFSEKEYITRLDNLLYMIHQVQKLPQYESISDYEFFKMFKEELCRDEFASQIAKDAMHIDQGFNADIMFFIAAYICFDGDVFEKLCADLANRI